jgi:hypothetical protein
MPIGKPIYREKSFFDASCNIDNFYGFLDVVVSFGTSTNNLPVLTYKFSEDYYSKNPTEEDMGILYPKGLFRGTYFSEELKYALSKGYKIIAIYSGYQYEKQEILFNDFIDFLYEKRKSTTDKTLNAFYKKLMNTLYGRLAINFDENKNLSQDTDYDNDNNTDEISPHKTVDFYKEDFSNIAIASAISAYARMYVYDILDSQKVKVFYWDTDGIFINT